MKFLYRPIPFLAAIVVCSALCAAQTPSKEPTASVSGHVTVSGKAAPGITVVATIRDSFFNSTTVAKATTDEDGNYKLTGLTAGRFTIRPLAKSHVGVSGRTYREPAEVVNVTEGEAIARIDFALVRGGVITGRITDADGHPIVDEKVNIFLKDGNLETGARRITSGPPRNQTDDRGVYRAYGLAPGNYRVSVGEVSVGGPVRTREMGGSPYLKTFYPGVQDESGATIIEIKEGTEVENVDLAVSKPGSGFSVSGRVIDSDSGKPVADVYVGYSSVNESSKEMGQVNYTDNWTDANGKFEIEELQPGHYAAFKVAMGRDNSTYSEAARFEISDGDVTGIEIKVRPGATISGVAVIDNNPDPAIAALLQTITLYAVIEAKGLTLPSYGSGQIGPDGNFSIKGLAPGRARIGVQSFPDPPKSLSLVRTEVDGLIQLEGIEVAPGAQINGVRLLFAYGTGSISGAVKIEGGSLPKGMSMRVLLRSAANDFRPFSSYIELDARLKFVIENIPPGNYELVVLGSTPRQNPRAGSSVELIKQSVTVTNGTELKLNLVVDAKATQGAEP